MSKGRRRRSQRTNLGWEARQAQYARMEARPGPQSVNAQFAQALADAYAIGGYVHRRPGGPWLVVKR